MKKASILLIILFQSMFITGKTHPLNYKPIGKIISITFDSCVLYTDTSGLFASYNSLMTFFVNKRRCRNILEYNRLREFIKMNVENKDTLSIELTNKNMYSRTKLDTLFDYVSIASKLIEINKAQVYSKSTLSFISNVKIRISKKKGIVSKEKTLYDNETNCILLSYKIDDGIKERE